MGQSPFAGQEQSLLSMLGITQFLSLMCWLHLVDVRKWLILLLEYLLGIVLTHVHEVQL